MSISNASLGKLGVARDNHGSITTTTTLSTDATTTSLATSYEVTSVSLAGNTTPESDVLEYYTLSLAGGSRRAELQSSGRANVSYTVSSGNSVILTANTQCRVRWTGSLGAAWVKASWSDTYNAVREYTLNVTIV